MKTFIFIPSTIYPEKRSEDEQRLAAVVFFEENNELQKHAMHRKPFKRAMLYSPHPESI